MHVQLFRFALDDTLDKFDVRDLYKLRLNGALENFMAEGALFNVPVMFRVVVSVEFPKGLVAAPLPIFPASL